MHEPMRLGLDLRGPALLLHLGGELADGARAVGRVRPHDVRLELGQVHLDHLVEVLLRVGEHLRIGDQVGAVRLGERGLIGAIGRAQVGGHAVVEVEEGGGGAELGAHVADRALAGGADRLRAGAEVLDDLVGAALHGEEPAEIGDDVLGRGPAAELAGEPHAHELGIEHLPRQPRHRLAAIRAADPDGGHAEAARVGRVRVGADHETAGEGVVLQHDLMDDAGPRLPEADPVLLRGGVEELVHLAVLRDGPLHVVAGAALGADQVVAVHRRRHRDLLLARLHELQQRHLAGGVLQGHAVHAEPKLRLAAAPLLLVEVVGVGDEDLLGEGEGSAEALAGPIEPGGHGFIETLDLVCRHGGPPSLASGATQTYRLPPVSEGRRPVKNVAVTLTCRPRRGQGAARPPGPTLDLSRGRMVSCRRRIDMRQTRRAPRIVAALLVLGLLAFAGQRRRRTGDAHQRLDRLDGQGRTQRGGRPRPHPLRPGQLRHQHQLPGGAQEGGRVRQGDRGHGERAQERGAPPPRRSRPRRPRPPAALARAHPPPSVSAAARSSAGGAAANLPRDSIYPPERREVPGATAPGDRDRDNVAFFSSEERGRARGTKGGVPHRRQAAAVLQLLRADRGAPRQAQAGRQEGRPQPQDGQRRISPLRGQLAPGRPRARTASR